MRYQTIAYCVDPDCRCLDRNGVILYDGPSREDAERAMAGVRIDTADYRVVVEELN